MVFVFCCFLVKFLGYIRVSGICYFLEDNYKVDFIIIWRFCLSIIVVISYGLLEEEFYWSFG